jgi:putative transposase
MPMSTKLSAGRVRSTYEFIKANRGRYSVQAMCRILGVAPSGYYEWLTHPISNRAQEDARLLRLIRASFTASQGIYGAPRVFLDLREAGETCSKHRVARLMRVNRLRALHGYRTRRWSVGKPAVLIPNLLQRQFTVTRRNKAWVADITYTRTWQGWLCLAVVMDLFAQDRRLVGTTDHSPRARARRGADGRASLRAAVEKVGDELFTIVHQPEGAGSLTH